MATPRSSRLFNIQIGGTHYQVQNNTTILEACRQAKLYLPALCYHPDLPPSGHCDLCAVKINGSSIALACTTKVHDGMAVSTNSRDIIGIGQKAYRAFIGLKYPLNSPDVESVVSFLFPKHNEVPRVAEQTNAITFTPNQCVNCSRCDRICADVMNVGAFDDPALPLANGPCVSCGQCTIICPTNALTETSHIPIFYRALAAGKTLCAIVDPAAFIGLNEILNKEHDETGKFIGALKALGFQRVFDLKPIIDLVTMELAEEVLKSEKHPFILNTCPAFVNFVEKSQPEMIKLLSTLKSPAQYMAQMVTQGSDSSDLFVIQITPCIAAKDEIQRMQLRGRIEAVLTVREIVELVAQFGIEWMSIAPSAFEKGSTSFSKNAIGTLKSGGWTQAILSYIHEKETGTLAPEFFLPFSDGEFRTFCGYREVGQQRLKVAICDGLSSGQEFLASSDFDECNLVEINVCRGGCVFGGGRPKFPSREIVENRVKSLLSIVASSSQHFSAFSVSATFPKSLESFRTSFEPRPVCIEAVSQKIAALPLVVDGSTSGKAAHHARLIARYLHTSAFSMNRLTVKDLLLRKIVIFVCSTTGVGEFPVNARKFASILEASQDNLSDVSFSVVALERHEAEYFAAAGKKLQELMLVHGAKSLLPLSCLDSSAPDADDGRYADWSRELATALSHRKNVDVNKKPELIDDRPSRPRGFEFAKITEISFLTAEGQIPAVRRIVIDLPDGLRYDSGDHLGILPCNPDDVVKDVLNALGFPLDTSVTVDDPIIPGRVSVHNLFWQYLDLGGIPSRSLLKTFEAVAIPEGKQKIALLLNENAYTKYIENISIGEFICEFAQYGVPSLETLVAIIPHMKPRFYSITCPPDARAGGLEICVMEVKFGKDGKRSGLASSYVARRGGQIIAIFTRPGKFKYPSDPTTPLIMVALGIGISAMLPLLKLRESSTIQLGPCILILSTRFVGSFPYLLKYLHRLADSKIITHFIHIAFRDGHRPLDIQQCMRENSERLWELWEDYRTTFYYCGQKKNIPEELKQIMIQITINEGWLSMEEAMAVSGRHPWHIETS
jgi:sulfite reductase alpha subunit-like flavoprotein/iron only hydrogenase large subunit-like protein